MTTDFGVRLSGFLQPPFFVGDLSAGTTVRVSLGAGGVHANSGSRDPSLTTDGKNVTFYSHATNLVANDTNGQSDIFVVNIASGEVTRASLSSLGVPSNGSSLASEISENGRVVVFFSFANNLVAGDTNGVAEVFTRRYSSGGGCAAACHQRN